MSYTRIALSARLTAAHVSPAGLASKSESALVAFNALDITGCSVCSPGYPTAVEE